MTKVLILSVHVPHRHGQHWRRLQAQFVATTSEAYEYGVIVNGADPTDYTNMVVHIPKLTSHRQGITRALELFRQHRHRFSHFLLLDSDCWPVRADWVSIINRLLDTTYMCAAPVRAENFDIFPHPCAFYMAASFLEYANFNFSKIKNLLGLEIADVGTAMPVVVAGRPIWYPLPKTNYIAPHPVYASIYGDLFYHHCAGSRGLGFRAGGYRFYDHILDQPEHRKIYSSLTTQLVRQPRHYLDKLRGVGRRAAPL